MKRLYSSLFLLSLIWGSSFFFIKILLADYEPASIVFIRCLFGLITIAIIMIALRKPADFHKVPWRPMIIVGLFQTTVPWYLIGFSETKLATSMASVLNATTPLWTIIIGLLIFKVKAHRNQWLGVGLGFCGILVLFDLDLKHLISVDGIGVIAMLMATFCYGYSSQLSKRELNHLSVYQTVLYTLFIGMISSGILALSLESISLKPLIHQPVTTFSFIVLGSLSSAIGYMLFFYMLQRGSAEFSTMVTYLVPVTAIIWGVFLLDETIDWTLLAGLGFILLGVSISGNKPKTDMNPAKLKKSHRSK